MKKATLYDVWQLCQSAQGQINRIYLHWTAARYGQQFDDYHFNVDADGSIYQTCSSLTERKSHTWHRNTGAIGIALCCAYKATAYADGNVDFGAYPPTVAMLDSTAQLVAIICNGLQLSTSSVLTHAEIADVDNYGPSTTFERWDLWRLVDPADNVLKDGGRVLRGLVEWYRPRLKF